MPDKKKKKRVGSTIFRIVLIIIAGVTVGLGVFSWNASGLLGNQLPMPFGFGASVILSPSMEPVLNVNDLVFVTKADSFQEGDIVVYQEGNMLIIHRIISIDGDNVITKGDANNVADDPIQTDDILAKYSFRIPLVGMIVKYIRTVPGTLLILVLAIFLLYRSRQKEREKDKEELDDIVEEIKRLREQQAGSTDDDNKENIDAAEHPAEEEKEPVKDSSEPAAETDTEEEDPSEPAAETDAEEEDPSEPAAETDTEEEEPSEPAAETDTEEEDPSEPAAETDTEEEDPSEPAAETDVKEEEPSHPAEERSDDNTENSDNQSVPIRGFKADLAEVKSILEELS